MKNAHIEMFSNVLENNYTRVLEYIHKFFNIDYDLQELYRASNIASDLVESSEMMYSELLKIASTLDVSLQKFLISLDDIQQTANKKQPWIIYCNNENHKGWIVVETISGKKFRLHFLETSKKTWVGLKKFCKILGIQDATQPIHWIVPSSGLSLSPLESKGKSKFSPQKRLLAFLKIENEDLWVVIIYTLISGFFYLLTPVIVQTLVNTIAFGTLLQPFVILTVALFFVLCIAAIIGTLNSYIVELIQQRLFARIASDFSFRLPRVKASGFDKHYPPELVNRFFDVVTVQKSASTLVIDGISVLLQTALGMLFILFYHPALFLFDVILLFAICFVLFVLGRGAIKTSIKESYAKYAVVSWLQDVVRNRITFKSKDGVSFVLKKSDHYTRNYIDSRKQHFYIILRQIIGFFAIQAFANAMVLGFGGYLVISGELSLGQLVAAEVIITSIVFNLTKFNKYLATYYDLLAALDKLGNVIDLPIEKSGRENVEINKAISVEIINLHFAYKNDTIFHDANFSPPAGSIVAITGASGSGKSTFLDLLYALQNPTSGIIQYNKTDIRYFSLYNLRSHVCLIRDIEIFLGTIKENITLGQNISQESIENILKQLGIWEKIAMLPNGLETILNPSGTPLSTGICKTLMIARAILSSPRLLLLDQIMESMDPSLKQGILQYLKELCAKKQLTVIICCCDPETQQQSDFTYNIEEGKFHLLSRGGINHE